MSLKGLFNHYKHRNELKKLDNEFGLILHSRKQNEDDNEYMISTSDRLCKIRDEYDALIGDIDASETLLDKYARWL